MNWFKKEEMKKCLQNTNIEKRTIDIDVVNLTLPSPDGFGWRSLTCKASDFAVAIIEKMQEQRQTILEQQKKIAEQDRIIIALKAELGKIALAKEEAE